MNSNGGQHSRRRGSAKPRSPAWGHRLGSCTACTPGVHAWGHTPGVMHAWGHARLGSCTPGVHAWGQVLPFACATPTARSAVSGEILKLNWQMESPDPGAVNLELPDPRASQLSACRPCRPPPPVSGHRAPRRANCTTGPAPPGAVRQWPSRPSSRPVRRRTPAWGQVLPFACATPAARSAVSGEILKLNWQMESPDPGAVNLELPDPRASQLSACRPCRPPPPVSGHRAPRRANCTTGPAPPGAVRQWPSRPSSRPVRRRTPGRPCGAG